MQGPPARSGSLRRPCPPGHEGLHGDDNGFNNRLSNLRWGTRLDNAMDMVRNGKRKGEKNGRAKLTDEEAAEVAQRRQDGEPLKKLAAEFGISMTRVYQLAQEHYVFSSPNQ